MVKNTQSDEFKWNVDIVNVFEVERFESSLPSTSLALSLSIYLYREGEAARFQPFRRLPHHRLLWHGSRTPNYIGIISQGLRIAPPEAPVTGYFLGKGIYFADQVSVSSQYCHAKPASPYGYLMICDVALGRSFQIAHGKFIAKEDLDEAGFHSVKCCGTKAPHSGYDITTYVETLCDMDSFRCSQRPTWTGPMDWLSRWAKSPSPVCLWANWFTMKLWFIPQSKYSSAIWLSWSLPSLKRPKECRLYWLGTPMDQTCVIICQFILFYSKYILYCYKGTLFKYWVSIKSASAGL